MLPHVLGQVIANVFVGLGIVDAGLADPKVEIVAVKLDLIQQPPPERLILVVDRKHFPRHLLDIKIEVVVEDGVPVAITIGDRPVHSSLPQEVVEAVRVVCPTDHVKVVPGVGGRREHKLRTFGLLDAVDPGSNPVPEGQAPGQIEGKALPCNARGGGSKLDFLDHAAKAVGPPQEHGPRGRKVEMDLAGQGRAVVVNLAVEGQARHD